MEPLLPEQRRWNKPFLGNKHFQIAVSVSILLVLLQSPMIGAAPPKGSASAKGNTKAPAAKLTLSPQKQPAQNKDTASEMESTGTLKMGVAKTLIQKRKPAADCGIWFIPDKGFVDTCEDPDIVTKIQAEQKDIPLQETTEYEYVEASEDETITEAVPVQEEIESLEQDAISLVKPYSSFIGTLYPDLNPAPLLTVTQAASDWISPSFSEGYNMLDLVLPPVLTSPSGQEEATKATAPAEKAKATPKQKSVQPEPLEVVVLDLSEEEDEGSSINLSVPLAPEEAQEDLTPVPVTQTKIPSGIPKENAKREASPRRMPKSSGSDTVALVADASSEPVKKPVTKKDAWPRNPVSFVVKHVVGVIQWIFQ